VGAQFGLTLRRNQFGEADCCRKQGTASLEPNPLEACLTAGYLPRFRLTANIYEVCVPICIVQRSKAPAFVTACARKKIREACILTSSVWCLNWLPLMVIADEITGLLIEKESQSTDVKFHELMASWLVHSPLIGPNYLPIEAHGTSSPNSILLSSAPTLPQFVASGSESRAIQSSNDKTENGTLE
jgi:hypothetical protein